MPKDPRKRRQLIAKRQRKAAKRRAYMKMRQSGKLTPPDSRKPGNRLPLYKRNYQLGGLLAVQQFLENLNRKHWSTSA